MEDILQKRRSVRKFTEKPVPDDVLERVLRDAMAAPSAARSMPWEFWVVTKGADRAVIAQMSPYAKPAENAAALIIPCVSPENAVVNGQPSVWWVQDMAACTENILLSLVKEGLGGVWMGFYPEEDRVQKLKDYLRLPGDVIPFAVVALGYPAAQPPESERWYPEKVHFF